MTKRFQKIIAGVAALAAFALGGAAISQATSPDTGKTPSAGQERPVAPESSAADPDNVQDENGKDDATERSAKGESEKDEAGERGEQQEAEGREVPGDDGARGHADEPSNPNADHQFEGRE